MLRPGRLSWPTVSTPFAGFMILSSWIRTKTKPRRCRPNFSSWLWAFSTCSMSFKTTILLWPNRLRCTTSLWVRAQLQEEFRGIISLSNAIFVVIRLSNFRFVSEICIQCQPWTVRCGFSQASRPHSIEQSTRCKPSRVPSLQYQLGHSSHARYPSKSNELQTR